MKSIGFLTLGVIFFASVSLIAAAAERVSIHEWDVPTAKSLPHDPAGA